MANIIWCASVVLPLPGGPAMMLNDSSGRPPPSTVSSPRTPVRRRLIVTDDVMRCRPGSRRCRWKTEGVLSGGVRRATPRRAMRAYRRRSRRARRTPRRRLAPRAAIARRGAPARSIALDGVARSSASHGYAATADVDAAVIQGCHAARSDDGLERRPHGEPDTPRRRPPLPRRAKPPYRSRHRTLATPLLLSRSITGLGLFAEDDCFAKTRRDATGARLR